MSKFYKIIHSIFEFVKYKLCYKKNICINWFNLIEGKLDISINDNSKIIIEKKLMTRGPLYLRTLKNGKLFIGKNVFFNHNCSVTSMDNISIGNNCMFGNNIVIVDHNHINNSEKSNDYSYSPIIIEDNVWVGANSTILKGVTIGKNAVIAANSLVNKNVPSGEVWGGIPIKKIK